MRILVGLVGSACAIASKHGKIEWNGDLMPNEQIFKNKFISQIVGENRRREKEQFWMDHTWRTPPEFVLSFWGVIRFSSILAMDYSHPEVNDTCASPLQ